MLNKAILMGRLTRDPEIRHTQSNIAVVTFSLAVERSRKRDGDSQQQTVDFINIVAWDKTAEFVNKYFTKGKLVAVAGRIQARQWTDNEDKKRTAFEVVAEEVHFAESKQSSEQNTASQRTTPPVAVQRDIPDVSKDGFDEKTGDGDDLPF